MTDSGEIKQVDIRNIWPSEAMDFTPWLAENIEQLSQSLGMELEVQEREAGVGDFSLDIMAKDLGLILSAAEATKSPLLAGSIARQLIEVARATGYGGKDWSVVAKVIQQMAGE